jgi:hypothetical protein
MIAGSLAGSAVLPDEETLMKGTHQRAERQGSGVAFWMQTTGGVLFAVKRVAQFGAWVTESAVLGSGMPRPGSASMPKTCPRHLAA